MGRSRGREGRGVFSYGGVDGGAERGAEDVGKVRRVDRWVGVRELNAEQRMRLSEEVANFVMQCRISYALEDPSKNVSPC